MHKNKQTPLARKLGDYTPSSDLGSFEAFEAKKSKKRGVLFPLLMVMGVIATALFAFHLQSTNDLTYTPRDNKTTNGSQENLFANENSVQEKTPSNTQLLTNKETVHTDRQIQTIRALQPIDVSKNTGVTEEGSNSHVLPIPSIALTKVGSRQKLDAKYQPSILLDLLSIDMNEILDMPSEAIGGLPRNIPNMPDPQFKQNTPSWSFSIGSHFAQNRLVLANDANQYLHPDFEKILNQTIHSDIGVAASITYSLPVYKGFGAHIGVGYTSNRLKGFYKFTLDSLPVYDIDNTIAGFIQLPDNSPLRNIDLGSSAQQFSFINIPIGLTYSVTRPQYSFDMSVGTDFAFLTGARGNVLNELNITEVNQLKDIINPKYNSLNGRVSAYRRLNSLLAIGLSSGYAIQSNALYKGTQYRIKNTALDLQVILRFNLLKK